MLDRDISRRSLSLHALSPTLPGSRVSRTAAASWQWRSFLCSCSLVMEARAECGGRLPSRQPSFILRLSRT